MEDFYREHILDHYKNPRNRGELERPDVSVEDSNPLCGDVLRMEFRIREGRVEDVRFSGRGCSISLASASMLTERIKGQSLEDVRKISREDVLEDLGIELGPVRLKCALLALKVLKSGVYGIHGWPGEEDDDGEEGRRA